MTDWRFRPGWKHPSPPVPLPRSSLSPVLALSRRVLGGAAGGDGFQPSRPSAAVGRAAGGEQGERAPQGSPRPLQGVGGARGGPARRHPRPRPSSPPGLAGPRERRPLGAGPGKRTPTPPGRRVPAARHSLPRPRRAGTLLGALRRDPRLSPQRRHGLGVREAPRGRRAAERAPRGQLGHPGAPRGGQVR